jgi:hypothetical protein
MSSVFLSHNTADKPSARRLAHDLVLRGVRVWLDEAELVVGDSLLQKISSAIEEMDYLAVLLSPASVRSRWVAKELELAMSHQLKHGRAKVLPIVVESCEIPSFLRDTFYLRLDSEDAYQIGLYQLMRRLVPGVAHEPTLELSFPIDGGFDWVRNAARRRDLLNAEPAIRIKALEGLRGTALVIPVLLESLVDTSPEVVKAALDALARQQFSDGFWQLEGKYQEDPFGRHHSINERLAPVYDYLEHNKLPQQTIVKLFTLIASSNETISAIATFTLALASNGLVVSRLISAVFTEERDLVREISVWGLAKAAKVFPSDSRIRNALRIAAGDLVDAIREKAEEALRFYAVQEARIGYSVSGNPAKRRRTLGEGAGKSHDKESPGAS